MTDDVVLTDRLITQRFAAMSGDDNTRDWLDVGIRARALEAEAKRPRRHFALAAALAAAIVVPAAVAARATGLLPGFHDQPAPLLVQEKITELAAADLSGRLIAQGIRATEAKGVLAMQTPAGTVRVWIAPTTSGNVCSLFQIDDADVQSLSCGLPVLDAPIDIEIAHLQSGVTLIDGRVNPDTRAIALRLADGSEQPVPIVDGHFAALTTSKNPPQSIALDRGPSGVAVFPVPER